MDLFWLGAHVHQNVLSTITLSSSHSAISFSCVKLSALCSEDAMERTAYPPQFMESRASDICTGASKVLRKHPQLLVRVWCPPLLM
jgi:hypothetical protein